MELNAPSSDVVRHETFHWSTCRERLTDLGGSKFLTLNPKGRFFEAPKLRVLVPNVVPLLSITSDFPKGQFTDSSHSIPSWRKSRVLAQSGDFERYLESLSDELPAQVMILIQAGSVSLGYFEAGQAQATKTLKRYVVRGKGRAQATYLAQKGKSRFGSRLRLRNAQQLFEETNAKLIEWWAEYGEPQLILVSAPRRLWPELFVAKPPPPFSKNAALVRVPLDLPVPTTSVLLRAYKAMEYGRIEWMA